MSSIMMIDALSLLAPVHEEENRRMQQAQTIVGEDIQRNRFDTPLSRNIASDRRELAALALARAEGQGPSLASMQGSEAIAGLAGQPTAGGGLKGAATQMQASTEQGAQIAGQTGAAVAGESAQAMQQGLGVQMQDARMQMIKDIKDRELATSLAALYLQNEARAVGREANLTTAKMGIKSSELMQERARADQMKRRWAAGVTTGVGTGLAAAENYMQGQTAQAAKAAQMRDSRSITSSPGAIKRDLGTTSYTPDAIAKRGLEG